MKLSSVVRPTGWLDQNDPAEAELRTQADRNCVLKKPCLILCVSSSNNFNSSRALVKSDMWLWVPLSQSLDPSCPVLLENFFLILSLHIQT